MFHFKYKRSINLIIEKSIDSRVKTYGIVPNPRCGNWRRGKDQDWDSPSVLSRRKTKATKPARMRKGGAPRMRMPALSTWERAACCECAVRKHITHCEAAGRERA